MSGKEEAHKAQASSSHDHKGNQHGHGSPGMLSEAQLAKYSNFEGRIINKEGTGQGTTLLTITKSPDHIVVPEGNPGCGRNYVKGLDHAFWVKSVSEDQTTVVGVVDTIVEAFHEHNYDTVVLNASVLPKSLTAQVMEKDTKARIIGISYVAKNPNIVGDEAQMSQIMIGMGILQGGHWGMHGRVVSESGHDVPNGHFEVIEVNDRVMLANVDLRFDDLKGCHVVMTPDEPQGGKKNVAHKTGVH
jgi:hypothetical protein